MIKLYSVHDHWTDINKKNDVDIESIDGVIAGIKVNGEDYGGIEWQNIYDNTINTVLDSDGFYTTNIGVVIEADSIRVTFDGVEYSCPKRSISEISTNFYGAPTPLETGEESFDWTDFPFSIVTGSNGASMVVTTQTAGTHTLKIDTPQSGGGSSWQTVFEGSVETVDDDGDISGIIENLTLSGDSIKVTLNGTEYILPKTEHGYGAENESGLDFSTYPLFIATGEGADSCTLWTPTAGTYTLKIEEPQSGGGGSSDLVAVGIYNTYNTTVTLKYYEQQGATPVDYAIEGKTGIALSVPKNSGFVSMEAQYKIGSKTADAFVIETQPFSSATVLNAGVLVLESSLS